MRRQDGEGDTAAVYVGVQAGGGSVGGLGTGGCQYASGRYAGLLASHGIKASMSRKGNCWDNACSETLFGSLKVERLHGMEFHTLREAKDATLDWMLWYNRSRLHSTLNDLSPTQFEQQATARQHA